MQEYKFDKQKYTEILKNALDSGYQISPIKDCETSSKPLQMLLRHDIDFSLEYAYEMAVLENSLSVRSTYYILLYNNFYNPLSPNSRNIIRQIAAMGHEIGIHWDSSLYSKVNLQNSFELDLKLLSGISGQPVISASQHIPIDSPFFDVTQYIQYEAYLSPIFKKYRYVSDSAMTWRDCTPEDIIAQKQNFQFLAHPIWWMAPGVNSESKLQSLTGISTSVLGKDIQEFTAYMQKCLQERRNLDEKYKLARS